MLRDINGTMYRLYRAACVSMHCSRMRSACGPGGIWFSSGLEVSTKTGPKGEAENNAFNDCDSKHGAKLTRDVNTVNELTNFHGIIWPSETV